KFCARTTRSSTLSAGTKWPLTGGVPPEMSYEDYEVAKLFIAGYQDGSLKIWDATYPILGFMFVLEGKVCASTLNSKKPVKILLKKYYNLYQFSCIEGSVSASKAVAEPEKCSQNLPDEPSSQCGPERSNNCEPRETDELQGCRPEDAPYPCETLMDQLLVLCFADSLCLYPLKSVIEVSGCEVAFISFLDDQSRFAELMPCLHDKVLASATAATLNHSIDLKKRQLLIAIQDASAAAAHAKEKLVQRQEKLELSTFFLHICSYQRISQRTEELQDNAESFAAMANELVKTMENKKWWKI
ncbi:hypothetical protein BHE74_00002541, partial [Ensete ventricosum]